MDFDHGQDALDNIDLDGRLLDIELRLGRIEEALVALLKTLELVSMSVDTIEMSIG